MASSAPVPVSTLQGSGPDAREDLTLSRNPLSFSSSSLGSKDDPEFWLRTRKEMITPTSDVPGRASSAPSLLIPKQPIVLGLRADKQAQLKELEDALEGYRVTLIEGNNDQQAEVLLALRKKLTDPDLCPDVSARLFDSDIIHLLLDTFVTHTDWKLQFNGLICLKEMCTCPTAHTPALSIVRTMLELLDTSNIIEVIEVVLVILGHMTQDEQPLRTRNMRHLILNHNVLNRITNILIECNAEKLIPAVAWLASTLIEEPMPSNVANLLSDEFIGLLMRMTQSADADTQSNALCALCGVVEGYKYSWELIVHDNPLLPKLVEVLSHPNPRIALWGLKIFGNITSTEDESMLRTLLEAKLVEHIRPLAKNENTASTLRLWIAFALSNILTGLASHVDLLISQDIFSPLVSMAETEARRQDAHDPKFEYQIVVNAACALANVLANTNSNQARLLIGQRTLEACTRALAPSQPEYVLEAIISALMHVLTEADTLDLIQVCSRLDKCNTPERLRSLAYYPNKDIVDNTNEILLALNTIKFAAST